MTAADARTIADSADEVSLGSRKNGGAHLNFMTGAIKMTTFKKGAILADTDLTNI